jgi:hypothetical protein
MGLMMLGTNTDTEALVPEHSIFEGRIAVEKLEQCISPGFDQILAELVHSSDETLYSEVR